MKNEVIIGKRNGIIDSEASDMDDENFDWEEFYGVAKVLWNEDAQIYVNHLREDH